MTMTLNLNASARPTIGGMFPLSYVPLGRSAYAAKALTKRSRLGRAR